MIDIFTSTPDLNKYASESENTQSVSKFFQNEYGGPSFLKLSIKE